MSAADWIHWRGPKQDGHVTGQNLPATFGIDAPGRNGLVWKAPVGGRNAPLLMDGKLYVFGPRDPDTPVEGERITCFNADTGKVLWEYKFNNYHSDVEYSRLGWTSLTADPATKRIYCHGTGGELFCLDDTGKKLWSRQLSEEFGRFTGYGGRIPTPLVASGLVIAAVVNSSWGGMAQGWNRFLAFDGATGQVVWIGESALRNNDTYQSSPVVATIGGQRLLIAGSGDGTLVAFKVRTGERVWSYRFCSKAVNPSPVVDGNLVYCAHGDENPEGGPIGRVICVDASKVDPKTKTPAKVWDWRRSNRFGLSHPALADGRLYIPDDASELFCFNAKTGKLLWRYRYGTTSRGAPLVVDNKLYVFDVNAKLTVLTLRGDEEPDEAQTQEYTFPVPKGVIGFNETNGHPIAANGRMYFVTTFETYCVGSPTPQADAPAQAGKPAAQERPFDPAAAPVALRLFPYEVSAKPGEAVKVEVKYLDSNGRELPAPKGAAPQWSLPVPPVPKGKTTAPPALKGELKGEGNVATVALDNTPGQQGLVGVTVGTLKAEARVRVVPQMGYKQDFEKVPEGGVPAGWVNTAGKYTVKVVGGQKVLSKVNTDGRPPIARANGYFTDPSASNYTVECDLLGTEVGGKYPDMGLVNSRYTLILDGKPDPESKGRTLRLAAWDPRGRYPVAVPFDWQKDTWYRAKFQVIPGDKAATARAKVWKRGEPEPDGWTIQHQFPGPNTNGAAAVYGYISNSSSTAPGSEILYDNLSVTPNK